MLQWSAAVRLNRWPPAHCSSFTAQINPASHTPSSSSWSHYLYLLPFLPTPPPRPSLSPVLKWNRIALAMFPLFGVRKASPQDTSFWLNNLSLLLSTHLRKSGTKQRKIGSLLLWESEFTVREKVWEESFIQLFNSFCFFFKSYPSWLINWYFLLLERWQKMSDVFFAFLFAVQCISICAKTTFQYWNPNHLKPRRDETRYAPLF